MGSVHARKPFSDVERALHTRKPLSEGERARKEATLRWGACMQGSHSQTGQLRARDKMSEEMRAPEGTRARRAQTREGALAGSRDGRRID